MKPYALVTPATAGEWESYHTIRRVVLFEARGQFGVYDPTLPRDASNHHPRLLLYGDDPVGVIGIDIDGPVATLRRVAIREDVQRRGHGRRLLQLAEQFALESGCTKLMSFVAPDAVGFYQRLGFSLGDRGATRKTGHESVFMTKILG